MRYVGLIPAAGRATRLGEIPTSKEILSVKPVVEPGGRPRAAIDCLLEALAIRAVDCVYVVIRDGKWDIPQYLGDGSRYGLSIAYLMMGLPYGPPYTLDQAYRFLADRSVLFGFPDIQFHPVDAFRRLTARLENSSAEIVLGLFPTDRPHKMDMVRCDDAGRVLQLEIKPAATELRHTWIIAAWTPVFTAFLHAYLKTHRASCSRPESPEPHVGTVIQAALASGMPVAGEMFDDGWVLDIGTPEDLERARTHHPGDR